MCKSVSFQLGDMTDVKTSKSKLLVIQICTPHGFFDSITTVQAVEFRIISSCSTRKTFPTWYKEKEKKRGWDWPSGCGQLHCLALRLQLPSDVEPARRSNLDTAGSIHPQNWLLSFVRRCDRVYASGSALTVTKSLPPLLTVNYLPRMLMRPAVIRGSEMTEDIQWIRNVSILDGGFK